MNKYLPSKKFIYTVASIALATLIVLGLKALPTKTNQSNLIQNKANNTVTYQEFLDSDSDNDGLKDWEETLWNTDSKNPDTDADGTLDGEEVNLGRNPVIANTAVAGERPNDAIDPNLIAEQQKDEQEFRALSETDKIARVLFSQYITSKGEGDMSYTSKQQILDTAIDSINNIEDNLIVKYKLSDIKTSSDNSADSLKLYGNTLAINSSNQTGKTVRQEMSIFVEALVNEDPAVLTELDDSINLYSIIISNYLNMTVPSSLAASHLNILNSLVNVKTSVEKMKLLFTDTIQTILALKTYQEQADSLSLQMNSLRSYYVQQNIKFENTEPGYNLFNVIQ